MSDLISRADAIEAVAKLQKYDLDERNRLRIYAPWHNPKRIFVETEAIYKTIYTLPSAEDDWIPCSERLPAMGDYVLTYRPSLAMRMVVDSYEGYYGEDDDEWYEGWVYGGDKVVAWMPLPMPYREDGEV